MRRKVVIETLLLEFLAVLCVSEGLRLIIGKNMGPVSDVLGPGYYVLVLGCALLVLGILHFRTTQDSERSADKSAVASTSRLQMGGMALVLAAYIFLVDVFGYLFPSVLFFFFEFLLFRVRPWPKALVMSVGVTAVYYVVFVVYCQMSFPQGIFVK